nr:MAG TPA: hypothetical protein [Caudoviricetes sp.]DAO09445.1 MAG TPA: hypothetical protein [Caudoviricetes sp.]
MTFFKILILHLLLIFVESMKRLPYKSSLIGNIKV